MRMRAHARLPPSPPPHTHERERERGMSAYMYIPGRMTADSTDQTNVVEIVTEVLHSYPGLARRVFSGVRRCSVFETSLEGRCRKAELGM